MLWTLIKIILLPLTIVLWIIRFMIGGVIGFVITISTLFVVLVLVVQYYGIGTIMGWIF